MNNGVNFLKKQASVWQLKRQKVKLLQIASLGLLAIYAIIIILVFGYYFILKKQGETTKSQLEEVKNVLNNQQAVEAKQVLLKTKVASLTEILSGQKQHQKIIETIFAIIPTGMGISGLTIDPQGGVSFVARAQQLNVLNGFLNNIVLASQGESSIISEIKIQTFNFELHRGYAVTIHLLIGNKLND